ncbi:MAG: pentapeptide repeat-containing protein [Terracidiphilus sp.]
MISRRVTRRPEDWKTVRAGTKYRWLLPFRTFEWFCEWAAFGLSRWSFLEALEYISSLSVLVAVIFYFSESGDRVKQRHYQAWQVINTAQGKGGSGGRIEALQELNADKVPLVGVDVSSAFLQGIRLDRAKMLRADLNAADLRGSSLKSADFTYANLRWANFRGSDLEGTILSNADMANADLAGSNLAGAKLDGTNLSSADLRHADLRAIDWKRIAAINQANIAGVKNTPDGFREWALKNGAIESSNGDE